MLSASTALSRAAASLWPSVARPRLLRLVLLALLALLVPSLALAHAALPPAPSPFPHPRAASGPRWYLAPSALGDGPAASTDLGESTAPQAPDAHSELILRTPPARRGAGAWGPPPHTDHLGSTNYSTNNDQFLIQHDEYYPSGELWTDQTDSRYELARRFVFSGKEQDIHTGLIDFGWRSYDARQGQWLSPDPALDGLNLYAYVYNNPVNFIDPLGLDAEDQSERWHRGQNAHDFFDTNNGTVVPLPQDHYRGRGADFYAAKYGDGRIPSGLAQANHMAFARRTAETNFSNLVMEFIFQSYVTGLSLLGGEGWILGRGGTAAAEVAADAAAAARTAGIVSKGASPAARGAQGAFSRILNFTQRNLQKGFTKHGADFGMTGNWSPSRAADFSRAVNQHINAPGVRSITGTYRGNPVTHYVDPSTGLNVIADQAGNYVAGWRLGAEQLESVLTTGSLF